MDKKIIAKHLSDTFNTEVSAPDFASSFTHDKVYRIRTPDSIELPTGGSRAIAESLSDHLNKRFSEAGLSDTIKAVYKEKLATFSMHSFPQIELEFDETNFDKISAALSNASIDIKKIQNSLMLDTLKENVQKLKEELRTQRDKNAQLPRTLGQFIKKSLNLN